MELYWKFVGPISTGIITVYHYTGLTYVIEFTERYRDSRPADAFLLHIFVEVLIFVLLNWCLLWLFGIISLLWLFLGGAIFFVCPPFLTMTYIEGVMWWWNKWH